MTKQEALDAMAEAKKVTHRHFTDNEWMTVENGLILLEDGVRLRPMDFWKWRQDETWEDGYSLFEQLKQKEKTK